MLGTILGTMRRLTLLALCCMAGCVSQGAIPSIRNDISIPSQDAIQLLRQGKPKLIDTRTPTERSARRIFDSVSIPFGPDQWTGDVTEQEKNIFLTQVTAAGLTQDDLIVTVCNAGVRALSAATFLRSAGFTRVHSVIGGYIGNHSDPGWQFSQ